MGRPGSVICTLSDVRDWIAGRPEPRFILPARFRDVSFDSFRVSSDHPEHRQHLDRVREFVESITGNSRRFWRRAPSAGDKGLFLVGPPGVGKTHLLASSYHAAEEPKIFASFDELVAAAGPLGMQRLPGIVGDALLVCIDEVVLEDPGNIMMLVTLLQHMTDSGTRVIATANMPPEEAGGHGGWMTVFERELGSIAAVFEVIRLEGRDRRSDPELSAGRPPGREGAVVQASWSELLAYLADTHPMYDAGWLEQVGRLQLEGEIDPPQDKDQALRFVRFIDRVYDRAVELELAVAAPEPSSLVEPLTGDPRYVWHAARGASRLGQLLG